MASRRGKRSAKSGKATAASSSPAKRAKESTETPDKHECTHEFWDEFWEDEYDEASSHWGSEPNSFLVKHLKTLDGEKKKKEEIRVLVPMCGMSVDMKWLAEQGYQVVGLELAKKAVQRFFDKYDIKHSVEKKKDFSVFEADELPLKIYQGDMFKFTSALEPAFDAVWDSHAMHAVNQKDQKRYADTMKAVMTPDCRYLIDNMEFDVNDLPDGFHDHPHPHLITADDTLELFGDKYQVEELDAEDKTMDWFHMSGQDKEGKGHGHGAKGKGKGKAKQGKAKGHGDGNHTFKYVSKLYLMTRKPSKK